MCFVLLLVPLGYIQYLYVIVDGTYQFGSRNRGSFFFFYPFRN